MSEKGKAKKGTDINKASTTTESEQRKRTCDELSSVSEHELSISNQNGTNKQNKHKKKKSKNSPEQTYFPEETQELTDNAHAIKTIMKQLEAMNKKLSNVLTKDDRYIQDTVEKSVEKKLRTEKITSKDEVAIEEIVEKLVEKKINKIKASFEKRIEVLEGQLLEKAEENEKLKKEINALTNRVNKKQEETTETRRISNYNITQTKKRLNDLEQYTRNNSIRVYGLPDNDEHEPPSKTIDIFLKEMKDLPIDVDKTEIDTGHRLGLFQTNKSRPVIIKFISRLTKDKVMRNKKSLGQRKIFINEDLTCLNQQVFTAIRLKGQDEVKSVWTRNGRIILRRYDESTSYVEFEDYNPWLELPWPQRHHQQ